MMDWSTEIRASETREDSPQADARRQSDAWDANEAATVGGDVSKQDFPLDSEVTAGQKDFLRHVYVQRADPCRRAGTALSSIMPGAATAGDVMSTMTRSGAQTHRHPRSVPLLVLHMQAAACRSTWQIGSLSVERGRVHVGRIDRAPQLLRSP